MICAHCLCESGFARINASNLTELCLLGSLKLQLFICPSHSPGCCDGGRQPDSFSLSSPFSTLHVSTPLPKFHMLQDYPESSVFVSTWVDIRRWEGDGKRRRRRRRQSRGERVSRFPRHPLLTERHTPPSALTSRQSADQG